MWETYTPPLTSETLSLLLRSVYLEATRYLLLQVFSKFGKISKLDYLFHKSGPAKGKPRGYAFVEYSAKEVRKLYASVPLRRLLSAILLSIQDAAKALVGLHDKLVRGRKLVVTFAQQSTTPQDFSSTSSYRTGGHRRGTDTTKPTTLSLIKTHNKPASTKEKIAALEAKLKQMQRQPLDTNASGSTTAIPLLGAGLPPRPPPEQRSRF